MSRFVAFCVLFTVSTCIASSNERRTQPLLPRTARLCGDTPDPLCSFSAPVVKGSRHAVERPSTLLAANKNTASKGQDKSAYNQAVLATIWSFVATAVFGFGVVLPWKGGNSCVDFFTAFIVEKSLSVDNLFVFLMLFEYFQVPEEYTARVLKWGILSALALRGIMIAAGVMVIERFRPVLLFFSVILVVSAIKMLLPEPEGDDLAHNGIMRLAHKLVDATDTYDGDNFFTLVNGVKKATPLLVVLICVELSDVMFAVDSIPAVVGISKDPLIVYSSNVFALLALRSLYMLLSKSVQAMYYLKPAVALILLFIGGKMSLEYFHFHLPRWLSPSVILVLLATGTTASIMRNNRIRSEAQQTRPSA